MSKQMRHFMARKDSKGHFMPVLLLLWRCFVGESKQRVMILLGALKDFPVMIPEERSQSPVLFTRGRGIINQSLYLKDSRDKNSGIGGDEQ